MIRAGHRKLPWQKGAFQRELRDYFATDPSPRLKDLAFCDVCCETETPPSGLCSVQYSVLLIQLEEYWIQFESKFGVKKCPSVELLL